jgi:hypothetical protein
VNSQREADLGQPDAPRARRFLTINGAIATVPVAVITVAAIAALSGYSPRSGTAQQAKPHDDTSRMVAIVEGQPDYVMAFAADFGGDPEQYLPIAGSAPFDFRTLTAEQLGNAFRQAVEMVPPTGMPADLNLRNVNSGTVGGRVEQVIADKRPEKVAEWQRMTDAAVLNPNATAYLVNSGGPTTGRSSGARVLGARVLGARVLGARVLGARVLGARVLTGSGRARRSCPAGRNAESRSVRT